MSSGGGGTTTNVTNNQPPQQFLDAYTSLLNQANGVASTPLQQYNAGPSASNVVAPLNTNQNAAISDIAGAQGTAQPYINEGQQDFQAATTPLWSNVQQFSPQNINQYESPYTQQVVQATQNQFNNQNAQQQQGIVSNAISSGAWGGDRAGIAQSELANQQQLAQAPTIAGLENSGYTNAEQEFNTQQQGELGANEANAWLNSQAGFGLANLGTTSENTALSGASALLGAGGVQQQESQAQLNVPYEQFLQQQSYPFQTTQWLGNLTEGIGSNAGGTATGSTTQPSTDQTGQIIGDVGSLAGLAALAFMNRGGAMRNRGGIVGGRYRRDAGGIIPSDIPDLSVSFVPQGNSPMGKGPPQAGAPSPSRQATSGGNGGFGGTGLSLSDLKALKGSGTGLANRAMTGMGLNPYGGGDGIFGDANGMGTASDFGVTDSGAFDPAAMQSAFGDVMPGAKRGGRLAPGGIVGYDDGGDIDDGDDFDASAGHDVGQGIAPQLAMSPSTGASSVPSTGGGIAADPYGVDYQPRTAAPVSDDDKHTNIMLALASGLAGLGAGKSRNAAENIGQGIQQGLKTYVGLSAQDKADAEKQAEQVDSGNFRQSQLKLDASKMSDAATQAKTRLDQQQQQLDQTGKYQTGELANSSDRNDIERQHDADSLVPPEVRTAQWLSKATPEQRKSYSDLQQIKQGMAPSAAVDPNAPHGDEFLKTLPADSQAVVKAMVEGRQPPPTSFAISKPYWQAMIQNANQYDPTFDQTTWTARNATARDFSSAGKSGQAVMAINNALGHAGKLADAFNKLGNTGIPAVNAPMNWWKTNVSGDPSITTAEENIHALASEARKVFTLTGSGSQSDLDEWQKSFPINGSPDQQKSALNKFVDLLDSRLDALSTAHNVGFGKTDDKTSILSKPARDAYMKLTGQEPNQASIGPHTAQSMPIIPALPNGVPAGSFYSPSRQQWRDPAGKMYDATGKLAVNPPTGP